MDVQMEPCMQTSRIRNAISAVQLFVDRCLMNLESKVSPSAINAEQWDWMNHYRMWEANRKVFLYPENWLEPELRDDQSPFFRDTMSELLQSDITEESATAALLSYLSKLQGIAKLEPCGIHHDLTKDPNSVEDDVAHVVARGTGGSGKYYYRRCQGGYWSPWEQIPLDIEDNPVLPVVWKGRLFIFWLRIVKKTLLAGPALPTNTTLADIPSSDINSTVAPKVEVQAILCWSEYYNGGWQPTKTSDVNRPTALPGQFDAVGPFAFTPSILRLVGSQAEGVLRVSIVTEQWLFFRVRSELSYFVFYSPEGEPVRSEDGPRFPPPLNIVRGVASRDFGYSKSDVLHIDYQLRLEAPGGSGGKRAKWPRSLLKPKVPREVMFNLITDARQSVEVECDTAFFVDDYREAFYGVQNLFDLAFLYHDDQHTFYVRTIKKKPLLPIIATPTFLLQAPAPRLAPDASRIGRIFIPSVVRAGRAADQRILNPRDIVPGGADPLILRHLRPADALIDRVLAVSETVHYGAVELGPTGSVTKTK